VIPIPVKGALHLKSVCTALDDHTVLTDSRYFDKDEFSEYKLIEVPADESMAANLLRINRGVCMHAGFQRTIDLLRAKGFDIRTVDISEFLKAEAGLTCMSIPFYTADAEMI
jgi:dimethylargininase